MTKKKKSVAGSVVTLARCVLEFEGGAPEGKEVCICFAVELKDESFSRINECTFTETHLFQRHCATLIVIIHKQKA